MGSGLNLSIQWDVKTMLLTCSLALITDPQFCRSQGSGLGAASSGQDPPALLPRTSTETEQPAAPRATNVPTPPKGSLPFLTFTASNSYLEKRESHPHPRRCLPWLQEQLLCPRAMALGLLLCSGGFHEAPEATWPVSPGTMEQLLLTGLTTQRRAGLSTGARYN